MQKELGNILDIMTELKEYRNKLKNAKVETEKDEAPEKNIKCSFCNRLFLSEQQKTRHMKSKHSPKFKCLYKNCKCKYSNDSDLKTHMKIHKMSKDNMYKCKECSKCYQFKSELKTHQKSHSDFKEYVCHTCGKEFKHKGMLNHHATVHMLATNYFSCPIAGCGTSKNNVDLINEHIRLNHSQSNIYMCNTCKKTFKFCDGKKRHKCN